jgi:FdhD protein
LCSLDDDAGGRNGIIAVGFEQNLGAGGGPMTNFVLPDRSATAPAAADPMGSTPGVARAQSGTLAVRIERWRDGAEDAGDDRVAVEAPLEFLLHHAAFGEEALSFGATMRTPGDDEALAAGLLYGERLIEAASDMVAIETSTRRPNVVNVRLRTELAPEFATPARRFSAGSSCGVCGTTGLDAAIARAAATRIDSTLRIDRQVLFDLPKRMRESQARFADTGGIHAAAAFDGEGALVAMAEDVGRHNAFDKLVGASLLNGALPLDQNVVLLSGRASFELVQKALRAGVPILAAIGAPSSLAVHLAEAAGLTLVGFLRAGQCNVYAHATRLR